MLKNITMASTTFNIILISLFFRKYTDEELSYKVATSNDINSPIDRYLGLYGGHLNTFEVTGEYTNTVLSHTQKALDTNKIEGLVSWEVMMHAPESEVFSRYKTFLNNNN